MAPETTPEATMRYRVTWNVEVDADDETQARAVARQFLLDNEDEALSKVVAIEEGSTPRDVPKIDVAEPRGRSAGPADADATMTDLSAAGHAADPRLLVAFVSEDDELAHVRKAAVEVAKRSGARLILYDRDVASGMGDPLPTWWSAAGEEDQYGDPLSEAELRKLGSAPVADAVARARAAGVDAWGWLPAQRGTDQVVDYAREHGADLVLLPAELEEPGLAERLRGQTVSKAVEEAEETAEPSDDVAVVLVERDGSLRPAGP
jgi:nucleotide-binding universal stress UspA family protein